MTGAISPVQRERAIRVLWLAHEFDTATIAALLGVREAEVAGIVAKREAGVAPGASRLEHAHV